MMKRFFAAAIFGAALMSLPLFAEMENHYILGTNGLNSAIKPACGFAYTGIYTQYHANDLKNRKGKNIVLLGNQSHLNVNFLQNFFSFYSPLCFLGGKYGCQVNVPFASSMQNVVVSNRSFDVNRNKLRLADIYAEPINLRYHLSRLNVFLAYGVYIPTGKFKPHSLNNAGLGNFGNMFTAAGTLFLDCASSWSLSAYTTYEIHGKTRHRDYTPGNNLCIDWGLGKTFWKYFSIGLVGYFEKQLTDARGEDVSIHEKDEVWAIGGEFDVVVPQINFGLTLRYEHEFNAKERTQGNTFVAQADFAF